MVVRYPNVHVEVFGEYPTVAQLMGDEDAYSPENAEGREILESVRSALRKGGAGDEEIEAYTKEATSRCFNHLLFTTACWVQLHRLEPRYDTP